MKEKKKKERKKKKEKEKRKCNVMSLISMRASFVNCSMRNSWQLVESRMNDVRYARTISEYLNTMIFTIANDDVAVRRDGDPFETFELAVSATPTTEGLEKVPFGTEDLYAIVS